MFELHELTGVLPALISPLRKDSKVDEAAVGRLVEHVIDGGGHGLLALGSTGETASLDETARRTLLSNVVAAADGRVPVICGVAQSHLAAARIEVEAAARLGAAAALVAPPFYYLIDQATLLAFYRSLAKDSPLPILLYEGTIVGIKDSSRDFEYFEGVCIATRDLPRFRIFTGSDTMLLPALAMGGAGTICGAANVAPGWIVRIYEDFRRDDMDAARAGQDKLYQLVMVLRGGVFPAAIKAACHVQGICEPWCAPPVAPLGDQAEAKVRDQLHAWGLLTPAVQR